MREIKFRAWDHISKKYVTKFDEVFINDEGIIFKRNHNDNLIDEDYILEQFSGLHDKNGIEIYEGDIVSNAEGRYWTVEWCPYGEPKFMLYDQINSFRDIEIKPDPREGYYFTTDGVKFYDIEIIGNIHENKELLNKN